MCKHKIVSIVELASAVTSHDREENGEWTHVSEFGHLTGIIEVTCYECGLSRTYGRKRPKWVVKYIEEFYAPNKACT